MKITSSFKTIAATLITLGTLIPAAAADMTGAGSTFVYPIAAKWADAYKQSTGNGLNYQSIGSGGGIKQIKAKTVDFGASDMPLAIDELEKDGLVQFPVIMGGVVPVINLAGFGPGQIKLTGAVLADIYLGKITQWNDPQLAAINPMAKLPAEEIVVVHRADGSGTSFLFTDYLSKVNAEFKTKVGAGTTLKWPTGVGGKGNEGVAAHVQRMKGAIGYVEFAYAKKNAMAYAQLKNKDGQFVLPTADSFMSAAAGADWGKTPGFGVVVTDQPGKTSWPITGATFVIMHKHQDNPQRAKDVLQFFDWAYNNGAKMATELDYIPMPRATVGLIENEWKKQIKDATAKAIWP